MAITLYDVKKYGDYDYIQETQPTQDGRWLKISDGTSYDVVNGVAAQIETAQDLLIQDAIYPTLENVCNYLNSYFYILRQTQDKYSYSWRFQKDYKLYPPQRQDINLYESDSAYYSFDGTAKTVDNIAEDVFQVGDYVRVHYAKRNNLIANVTAKTTTQLTLDNDELRTTEENATIFLMDIPRAVENIVAQMINYDVFNREVTDLDSETVGNYSYSRNKDFLTIGGLDYPSSMTTSLKQYMRARIV